MKLLSIRRIKHVVLASVLNGQADLLLQLGIRLYYSKQKHVKSEKKLPSSEAQHFGSNIHYGKVKKLTSDVRECHVFSIFFSTVVLDKYNLKKVFQMLKP